MQKVAASGESLDYCGYVGFTSALHAIVVDGAGAAYVTWNQLERPEHSGTPASGNTAFRCSGTDEAHPSLAPS